MFQLEMGRISLLMLSREWDNGMKAAGLCVAGLLFAGLWFREAPAAAQGAPLFAVLNGGNVVSAVGRANKGDLDGYGSASILLVSDRLVCWTIIVVGIDTPRVVHIHAGKAGAAGEIVMHLSTPETGNPGVSSGCADQDPEIVTRIRQRPSEYYVLVHTLKFGAGALRGQLQ